MSASNPFRLDDRTALVTGGGTGIGLAVATQLHAAGATVVLVGRRPEPLHAAVAGLGSRAVAVPADVADTAAIPKLVQNVCDQVHPVNVLVHCAGVHLKGRFDEGSTELDQPVIDTHLVAALALSRAVVPDMRKHGEGCILYIGSMAALIGVSEVAAYSAAKGAIAAATRALAVELGPAGIRVNLITPGWIDTVMSQGAFAGDRARLDRVLTRTPLRRLGSPTDIGAAAVYLASPAAGFVTGANLIVDGGAAIGF